MAATIHLAYFNTTKNIDLFNATHDVKRALREANAKNGLVTVFVPGGCASVVLIENEKEIQDALKEAILGLVEKTEGPRPSRKSGSGLTSAHVQAALLPQSVSIPLKDGKLFLGPWQDVVVYDFDDKVVRREIVIQVFTDEGGSKK